MQIDAWRSRSWVPITLDSFATGKVGFPAQWLGLRTTGVGSNAQGDAVDQFILEASPLPP
jgi:hypothetical protein